MTVLDVLLVGLVIGALIGVLYGATRPTTYYYNPEPLGGVYRPLVPPPAPPSPRRYP